MLHQKWCSEKHEIWEEPSDFEERVCEDAKIRLAQLRSGEQKSEKMKELKSEEEKEKEKEKEFQSTVQTTCTKRCGM